MWYKIPRNSYMSFYDDDDVDEWMDVLVAI